MVIIKTVLNSPSPRRKANQLAIKNSTLEIKDVGENKFLSNWVKPSYKGGGGADVPLFETIKTNAGTQPKNELQQ